MNECMSYSSRESSFFFSKDGSPFQGTLSCFCGILPAPRTQGPLSFIRANLGIFCLAAKSILNTGTGSISLLGGGEGLHVPCLCFLCNNLSLFSKDVWRTSSGRSLGSCGEREPGNCGPALKRLHPAREMREGAAGKGQRLPGMGKAEGRKGR